MDNADNHLPGQQPEMSLFPVKEVEVEGIQMGVLNNGTPYLTIDPPLKLFIEKHQSIPVAGNTGMTGLVFYPEYSL